MVVKMTFYMNITFKINYSSKLPILSIETPVFVMISLLAAQSLLSMALQNYKIRLTLPSCYYENRNYDNNLHYEF